MPAIILSSASNKDFGWYDFDETERVGFFLVLLEFDSDRYLFAGIARAGELVVFSLLCVGLSVEEDGFSLLDDSLLGGVPKRKPTEV